MTLPDRLEALLGVLQPCRLLADIGTDHGLLPIAAVQRGVAAAAIGIDREAPLAQARQNWEAAGSPTGIAWVTGLGLAALADWRPDAVAIAGMGAGTMIEILDTPSWRATQLILQPNTQPARVRTWAYLNGWHLRAEQLVEDRERTYAVMAYEAGGGPDPAYQRADFTAAELALLGPLLLAQRDAGTLAYYQAQHLRLLDVGGHEAEVWGRALV
ncbi:MAG: SAM-dependent methyltransferase [Cyanobacteria bacterium RYN_339]|nr:SAM-dependent methyltransferase [Cyanobacteria bacterium RYN_339]